MFRSPLSKGFALRNKLHPSCPPKLADTDCFSVKFDVDNIKEIAWNDESYGHLVYPEEQKDLALTFVESHK